MTRFRDVDDSVIEVFLELAEERFNYTSQLKIKFVFDTKKRIKNGKICLGRCELANDKIKYFSKDNIAVEGYDFVVFIDEKAWFLSDKDLRRRLLSHELRHIFIDEKGNYKIRPHDIEDFREEQILNKDDPDWAHKMGVIAESAYDQEKEMAKNKGEE
jgi:hypothetical protein